MFVPANARQADLEKKKGYEMWRWDQHCFVSNRLAHTGEFFCYYWLANSSKLILQFYNYLHNCVKLNVKVFIAFENIIFNSFQLATFLSYFFHILELWRRMQERMWCGSIARATASLSKGVSKNQHYSMADLMTTKKWLRWLGHMVYGDSAN